MKAKLKELHLAELTSFNRIRLPTVRLQNLRLLNCRVIKPQILEVLRTVSVLTQI